MNRITNTTGRRRAAPSSPSTRVAGGAGTPVPGALVNHFNRRRLMLAAVFGVGAGIVARPALATADELRAAIATFAGGAAVRAGRVTLDVAPLVENGNTVPLTLTVQSPMTAADHVKAVAVFNESNPQREVAVFRLGPRAGRAVVSTRIRLATSQQLVAVAQMSDGTFWSHTVDVIVTLAACVEA